MLASEARDSPELLAHLGRALGFANRAAEVEELPVKAAPEALASRDVQPHSTTGSAVRAGARYRDSSRPSTIILRRAAAAPGRRLSLRNMDRRRALRLLLEDGLARAPHSAAFSRRLKSQNFDEA